MSKDSLKLCLWMNAYTEVGINTKIKVLIFGMTLELKCHKDIIVFKNLNNIKREKSIIFVNKVLISLEFICFCSVELYVS